MWPGLQCRRRPLEHRAGIGVQNVHGSIHLSITVLDRLSAGLIGMRAEGTVARYPHVLAVSGAAGAGADTALQKMVELSPSWEDSDICGSKAFLSPSF